MNQIATRENAPLTIPASSSPTPTFITVEINEALICKMFDLSPESPNTQALFLICRRYGLDPVLKHVQIISFQQGKPTMYVTRDGLLHVAHRSGVFDGMEVGVIEETQTHYIARATVWRKDMSRPITMSGRYPKQGGNAKFAPEMAEKVAVARALRHAFDIGLCSVEETWEEEPIPLEQRPRATQESIRGNTLPAATPRQATSRPAMTDQPNEEAKHRETLIKTFHREMHTNGILDVLKTGEGKISRDLTYKLIAHLAGVPAYPEGQHPTPADIAAAINGVAEYAHKHKQSTKESGQAPGDKPLTRSTPEPEPDPEEEDGFEDPFDA